MDNSINGIKRVRLSSNVYMYSMGSLIFTWPRDLEEDLRGRSTVLFCGVTKMLEFNHYRNWTMRNNMIDATKQFKQDLYHLEKPKYIMIVDFGDSIYTEPEAEKI